MPKQGKQPHIRNRNVSESPTGKWEDIRKYGLILVIAVLYAIFATTLIDAILDEPRYEDFCPYRGPKYVPLAEQGDVCPRLNITPSFEDQCYRSGGTIQYTYDTNGCPVAYECSMCQKQLSDVQQKHSFNVFILSAILAGISIVIGLMLSYQKNILNEWVGSGLIFGGLFTLFIGTARSFGQIGEVYRPMVILAELILVIYLAYKLYGRSKE